MFSVEERFSIALSESQIRQESGKVRAVHGMVIEASGCNVHLGELVEVIPARGGHKVTAEVVALHEDRIQLMPFSTTDGLCLQSRVVPLKRPFLVPVGECLIGRVISAVGEPIDELGPLHFSEQVRSLGAPINPLSRAKIDQPLETGVRAVDTFIPLGKGQRLGIFAGSGVGKSTLLAMLTQHATADVVVVALLGERGREVRDFMYDSLNEREKKRTILIVATAEQPAVLRKQAAYTATAIAEWFRARGKNVLLIVDSMTRFAMAQREIGLATGEPMGSRGYPPSVFGMLPPLLERAGGLIDKGSITAIYTVLVEGDDMNDPVADHMRAILDGHIVLSRSLVSKNHFPAIDILNSVSRLNSSLLTKSQRRCADSARKLIATYSSSEDLIDIGAYESGTNKRLDLAIDRKPFIDKFLQQKPDERESVSRTWSLLTSVVENQPN